MLLLQVEELLCDCISDVVFVLVYGRDSISWSSLSSLFWQRPVCELCSVGFVTSLCGFKERLVRLRLWRGDLAEVERLLPRSRPAMSLGQIRAASGRNGGMLTHIIPRLHSMTERLRHGTSWTGSVSQRFDKTSLISHETQDACNTHMLHPYFAEYASK